MLDEMDKIGADFRGDPSSALLEVLDPEQNNTFRDHYLDVPFDLSKVMFIATANMLDPIPPAFRDRMEVIRLSGYTEDEKVEIARAPPDPEADRGERPHRRRTSSSPTPALETIIDGYTREAGVRNLEREIGAICRKVARDGRRGQGAATTAISAAAVEKMLGPVRALPRRAARSATQVGVATGLAWTSVGGDILFIEAHARARQGRADADRPARRRDEGVGAGGACRYARAHARRARHPRRLLRDARHPRPRAGGRDPEGRAVGGHHDRDRDDLRVHAARRCGATSR